MGIRWRLRSFWSLEPKHPFVILRLWVGDVSIEASEQEFRLSTKEQNKYCTRSILLPQQLLNYRNPVLILISHPCPSHHGSSTATSPFWRTSLISSSLVAEWRWFAYRPSICQDEDSVCNESHGAFSHPERSISCEMASSVTSSFLTQRPSTELWSCDLWPLSATFSQGSGQSCSSCWLAGPWGGLDLIFSWVIQSMNFACVFSDNGCLRLWYIHPTQPRLIQICGIYRI